MRALRASGASFSSGGPTSTRSTRAFITRSEEKRSSSVRSQAQRCSDRQLHQFPASEDAEGHVTGDEGTQVLPTSGLREQPWLPSDRGQGPPRGNHPAGGHGCDNRDDASAAMDLLSQRVVALLAAKSKGGSWEAASKRELITEEGASVGAAGLAGLT